MKRWELWHKQGLALRAWVTAMGHCCLTASIAGSLLPLPIWSEPAWGQSVYAQSSSLVENTFSESALYAQNETAVPAIGVVQSRDNIAHWPTIMARLNQANLSYQVIDWATIRRDSDLSPVSILILPSIEGVSSGQSAALQDFVAQGGHLIVSGAFGSDATSPVQQQLRSLVGAYWAFALPSPTVLYPTALRSLEAMNEASPIRGGVVMPMGLRSDTVATWQESVEVSLPNRPGTTEVVTQGSPAVVSTAQSTFLGWNWGYGDADMTFDGNWMAFAVDRHVVAAQQAQANSSDPAANVPTANTLLSDQIPQLTGDIALDRSVVQGIGRPPIPVPSGSSISLPRPVPVQGRPAPSPTPAPRETEQRSPLPPLISPANRVAPPGINVEGGSLPISPLEAIAMRQELDSLKGRFESALLSANAATSVPYFQVDASDLRNGPASTSEPNPTDVSQLRNSADDSVLVASTTSTGIGAGDKSLEVAANAASGDRAQAVLAQVQTLADAFDSAIDQRNYSAARQQWLQARQLLWDNFPSDRPIVQTEIRAMWFDRGTIVDAGSRQGLEEIFDRLAASGINTVFFETVNAGYPIYPSAVAPAQNPLISSSWDPLKDAVELAHERDMELHAWVWAFAAGNQRHNTLVNQPQRYLGPILDANPGWANYDDRGRIIPVGQTKPFLDPANPQVRQYLQDLYSEIVTNYDVDGLQLDYIRYPFQDPSGGRYYGYGRAARNQFRRETGVDPLNISPRNSQLWQEWTDFRIEQIDSFVTDVSEHLRQQRPDLIMSAAVFPMPYHERMQKLQQNWEAWAQDGVIDLIVTMSYAMDANRLQQLTSPWLYEANTDAETTDIGSALLLPAIRLLDLPDSSAVDQIQALRDMPAGGYALFAVENLNNNTNLQTIFNQTQGDRSTLSSAIPYRNPFGAAVERFEALNREWNFALSTEQLWLREDALVDLHNQSQALQENLRSLADSPSKQHLENAQQGMQEFQDQFEGWMSLHALENSYRVQTWTNHLAVVQKLLDYGEQHESL